jgi:hypothetical protein
MMEKITRFSQTANADNAWKEKRMPQIKHAHKKVDQTFMSIISDCFSNSIMIL